MSDFLYREPGKIIRDILLSEMELEPEQVAFTNQKYDIPIEGLFITVSYVGPSKTISGMSEWEESGTGLVEIQSATLLNMVQIDIMAYNDAEGGNQARARQEEVGMALRSVFSQQLQEKYNMQIARHIGAVSDSSFPQDAGMVTRYSMTVMTTSVNRKPPKAIDYYDVFRKPELVFNP